VATSDTKDSLDLLADVAGSFCARDAERVRAWRDAGGLLDREMWRRIADNGWLTILVPEDLGGAGLGMDAVAIVSRALGYGCFPEPFAAAGVLTPTALAAGGDPERLAPILAGERVTGVAWCGEVAVDGAGRLTGRSRFVGVAGADAYLVAGRSGAGVGLYWVEEGASGLVEGHERYADGTRSAVLDLHGTAGEELIGAPGGGAVVDAALDVARVAVSAELLGVADAALELTIDYLRQRRQFGRPIGSFQALQHRAVNMWMARELLSAALDAAVAVHLDPTADDTSRAIAASSVKARAAHAAPEVCTGALQLHGAIGFTDEYDLGLYLNRALTLAPWLGNATEHRRRHLDLTLGT